MEVGNGDEEHRHEGDHGRGVERRKQRIEQIEKPPAQREGEAQRDAEIALTKQWIDRAAVLGTSHIRVFAGQTKELARDEADKLVVSALEECSDYAGQRGIFLGIENHDAIGSWVEVRLADGTTLRRQGMMSFAARLSRLTISKA